MAETTFQNIPLDYVVDLNLSVNKKWRGNEGYTIDCPFCKGKNKLDVNLSKKVWRCAKCGESGNSITMHAKLHGMSNSEAYRDLRDSFTHAIETKQKEYSREVKTENLKPADIQTRHIVYKSILSCSELEDEHKTNLLKRGLTKETIIKNSYKSFPHGEQMNKVYECLQHFELNDLKTGIPGFVKTRSSIFIKNYSGIMIPIKTMEGYISGFQIRQDEPIEKKNSFAKYLFFSSSGFEGGTSFSGCENIHFAGDWSEIPEIVNLTEGVLKADVAADLSHSPFMGLCGVNNVSQLSSTLQKLKNMGLKKVNVCLDMDYREKKEVAKAMDKIKKIIRDCGLNCAIINWNPQYKGIDDFLLAHQQYRILKKKK